MRWSIESDGGMEELHQLRTMRGKNYGTLAQDRFGKLYVVKELDARTSGNLLFNEAFGSELGRALHLPFPAWREVWSFEACSRELKMFASEVSSQQTREFLPGDWLERIPNQSAAHKCLLFDLWCNHLDTRQAIFHRIDDRSFWLEFIDHDCLFGAEGNASIKQRVARTRYFDIRLYKCPLALIELQLIAICKRIETLLATNGLRKLAASIDPQWGTPAHRDRVFSDLERRSGHLQQYKAYLREYFALCCPPPACEARRMAIFPGAVLNYLTSAVLG